MNAQRNLVFLFDVDNTLLDNDRLQNDLFRHLAREFGIKARRRDEAIFEELRSELGYADYLGAWNVTDLKNSTIRVCCAFPTGWCDRPTGQQIARHLENVFAVLPARVGQIFAHADAGFYCQEAVEAYEKGKASFIILASKTRRLLAELQKACWKPSPKPDCFGHTVTGTVI